MVGGAAGATNWSRRFLSEKLAADEEAPAGRQDPPDADEREGASEVEL